MADSWLWSTIVSCVSLIAPQPCFNEFFVKFNFFNVGCWKTVISKTLGFGIIGGSVMVKVPQIVKIIKASSAAGINIASTTLELAAITASLAYGFAKGYPFSAYGESLFLVFQTGTICFLVLRFTRGVRVGVIYISVYVVILAFLLSPTAPISLLWLLQASVMPMIVTARAIQAITNYHNHSTGQLSAITVGLLLFGSIGRIFTSIQETGDITIILTFFISTLCNAVLSLQLWYYWGKENILNVMTTDPSATDNAVNNAPYPTKTAPLSSKSDPGVTITGSRSDSDRKTV